MRKTATSYAYASRLFCLGIVSTILALSGCGGGPSGSSGGGGTTTTVTSVTVSPTTATLSAGGITSFTATVSGQDNPSQVVTWSVNPTTAGTITSAGAFTASSTISAITTATITAASTVPGYTNITGTATVTINPLSKPSPTITATPGIITLGQSTVIAWNAGTNAASDSVSGPGLTTSTALTGTATVSPTATATYTISATNAGGTTTQSVTVTVNAASPTATLTCTPTSITLGSNLSCAIVTTNATQVVASSTDGSWSGSVTTNGTVPVTPTSTTGSVTYLITATGSGGSVTASSGVITVTNTQITLTSVNQPVTFCVGQCGFLTLTFTGANLATGQLPICTPNANIQLAQVLSSTQLSITFGIDQVHEGSGWRSCKICKSDGTGCSGTVAFGLYSQNMCAAEPSGAMFCLDPQETVAGQHLYNGVPQNGYLDMFTAAGVPNGKLYVGAPTCCMALDNVTGFVGLGIYPSYDQNGNYPVPFVNVPTLQGGYPEPVVATAAMGGYGCALQPTAPENFTCLKWTGSPSSTNSAVSINVGTNPQSITMGVTNGKVYAYIVTGGSSPALWSVDVSDGMTNLTSQPLTGVTANLPGGSAITVFDSLGTGLITSFGDKIAIPFSETTLKQGAAIALPGVPVSASSTANGIMVVGNADQPNAGGTLTEVNPTTGVATLVPSVETSVMPVGTVPAPTGKGFFVCPQDGISPCASYTLP